MDDLKSLLSALPEKLGFPDLVSFLSDKFQESLLELKEIDSTLTEIGKSANLTDSRLQELGDTSFEVAAKFGTSANDYLVGVQQMIDSGYKNAAQMAELSALVQTADNLQSDLANDYIMAADNAYDYAGNVEKLTKLLDGQNQMARENTLNMEELANATIAVSELLSDLPDIPENKLSALLGTGLSVSNDSGKDVAAAIKDIIASLNAMDSLRDPIELLSELADTYNALPDGSAKKMELLSDIGGGNHADFLDSLLSNWERYDKMLSDFGNASGSMMSDAEKSANSLDGALNSLSSTWTATVNNVINSDELTGIVETLNALLSGVNNVTEALGSAKTLGAIGGGILSAKNAGGHRMFCPI